MKKIGFIGLGNVGSNLAGSILRNGFDLTVRDLDKKAMIMRNHGLLTCGETVGEAFMLMYYLERACKVQMQVLASGQEFELPPPEVCEEAAKQYLQFPYGKYEWPALVRLVEKNSPDYRN